MKKSFLPRSSSPAQEKSKDCLSKAADDISFSSDFQDLGKGDRPSKSSSDPQICVSKTPSNSSSSKSSPAIATGNTTSTLVKDCKVVLERVSLPAGAGKPNEHVHCQSKPHKTPRFNSNDNSFLKNLESKQCI